MDSKDLRLISEEELKQRQDRRKFQRICGNEPGAAESCAHPHAVQLAQVVCEFRLRDAPDAPSAADHRHTDHSARCPHAAPPPLQAAIRQTYYLQPNAAICAADFAETTGIELRAIL